MLTNRGLRHLQDGPTLVHNLHHHLPVLRLAAIHTIPLWPLDSLREMAYTKRNPFPDEEYGVIWRLDEIITRGKRVGIWATRRWSRFGWAILKLGSWEHDCKYPISYRLLHWALLDQEVVIFKFVTGKSWSLNWLEPYNSTKVVCSPRRMHLLTKPWEPSLTILPAMSITSKLFC